MANLGIINNNPLNIRYSPSTKWKGQAGANKGFCVFTDMIYGYRAAIVLLCNYQRKGYDTIRKIITRWAPPSENNTEAYISAVLADMRSCGVCCSNMSADERIVNYSTITYLAFCMSKVEIGRDAANSIFHDFSHAVRSFKYPALKD